MQETGEVPPEVRYSQTASEVRAWASGQKINLQTPDVLSQQEWQTPDGRRLLLSMEPNELTVEETVQEGGAALMKVWSIGLGSKSQQLHYREGTPTDLARGGIAPLESVYVVGGQSYLDLRRQNGKVDIFQVMAELISALKTARLSPKDTMDKLFSLNYRLRGCLFTEFGESNEQVYLFPTPAIRQIDDGQGGQRQVYEYAVASRRGFRLIQVDARVQKQVAPSIALSMQYIHGTRVLDHYGLHEVDGTERLKLPGGFIFEPNNEPIGARLVVNPDHDFVQGIINLNQARAEREFAKKQPAHRAHPVTPAGNPPQ